MILATCRIQNGELELDIYVNGYYRSSKVLNSSRGNPKKCGRSNSRLEPFCGIINLTLGSDCGSVAELTHSIVIYPGAGLSSTKSIHSAFP